MTNKRFWIVGVSLIVLIFAAWRWFARTPTSAEENPAGKSEAGISAAVVPVERRDIANTLVLSGEFKPFQDVDVRAKVAGYIRTIRVDVGDHVKEGQTLAELEIPELAAQLRGGRRSPRGAAADSKGRRQKTEADISDTVAQYQFQLAGRTLKYVTGNLQ